jgi:L-histidine Nalpha-methyltransferase
MTDRVTVDVHLSAGDLRRALEGDVRNGLGQRPKTLPPVWFYDDRGSRLFEDITRLPEYYPTRAERRLLHDHGEEMTARSGADTFVEIGAGVCEKSRVLLDALARQKRLRRYVPFDVSMVTAEVSRRLADDYPGLCVHAVIGDFHRHLDELPLDGRRLIAFLGGTIGNFRPDQRHKFLQELCHTMRAGDHLLLGTDLVKDTGRLVAAYDDAAGVTAEFNRNVLHVMNRELGADFRPEEFEHVARWNADDEWIEMRLRASRARTVSIPALGMHVDFDRTEDVLTEISAKFTAERVVDELAGAGFEVEGSWGAEEGEFLLTLAHPAT